MNITECNVIIYVSFEDHYMFWLKSIDSFGDTKTPVLVVGTHADRVSENVSLRWIATLNFYFMDLLNLNSET